MGLLGATFETDMQRLYVPQRGPMARRREYLSSEFGGLPTPGIFVVHRNDGGDIMTRSSLYRLMEVHNRTAGVRVRVGPDEVKFSTICARRYVAMKGENVCLISSVLQLWSYSQSELRTDRTLCATVGDAWRDNDIDVGGAEEDPRSGCIRGSAVQMRYLFDADAPPEYLDTWEKALFSSIGELNEAWRDDPEGLRVSYWSQQLSTREAKTLVKRDGPLLGASMGLILVFVCLVLGGFTCDPSRSRVMLGSSCAITTALSMSSGFGIASILGIPLAPVSPLVCYTLLGVCVDDMIIIVDAFDMSAHPRLNISQQLQHAMAFAGTAITVTSVTTFFAMLTGAVMDLPTISLFCIPAAFCVVMVNLLQMTLFCGLLVLDARRRQAGLLDCWPFPSKGSTSALAVQVSKGSRSLTVEEVQQKHQVHFGLTRFLRDSYGLTLTRGHVRVAVMVVFAGAIAAAVSSMRLLQTGLPVKNTLPDDSLAREWFDDIDHYWAGQSLMDVSLVVRDIDLSDVEQLAGLNRTVAAIGEMSFVAKISRNWVEEYQRWCACVRCAPTIGSGRRAAPPGLRDDARRMTRGTLEAFLADGGSHTNCDEPPASNHTAVSEKRDVRVLGVGGARAASNVAVQRGGGKAIAARARRTDHDHGRRLSLGSYLRDAMLRLRRQRKALEDAIVYGGKEFERDIVFADPPGVSASQPTRIRAMRMPLVVRMPADNDVCYREHWPRFEAALEQNGISGYAYHPRYEFGYIDTRMPGLSLSNLIVAAGTISFTTSLFLPATIAVTLVIIVASIDVLLVGVIVASGLRLNAITFVTLLVSLALAIDYSCHIGHAYEMADLPTRVEKVRTSRGGGSPSPLSFVVRARGRSRAPRGARGRRRGPRSAP